MTKKANRTIKEIKAYAKKDKLEKLFRKHQKNIEIAAIILILSIIILSIFGSVNKKRQKKYSQKFHSAIEQLAQDNVSNAEKIFDNIYNDKKTPNNIRSVAGLKYAYIKVKNGKQEEAIKIYLEIFKKEKDGFIKYLAGTSAVNIMISQQNKDGNKEIDKLFNKLINPQNPLLNLTMEQKALFEIQRKNINEAVGILESILKSKNLDQELKIRTKKLLQIYNNK